VQARCGARTGRDALEPAGDVSEVGVELLADATAEVERAIEDDVGDGEAVAGDPRLPREQAVEPDEIVAHGRLEALGRFRQHAQARAEELDSLGEAEAVVEVLGDAHLDAGTSPSAR